MKRTGVLLHALNSMRNDLLWTEQAEKSFAFVSGAYKYKRLYKALVVP